MHTVDALLQKRDAEIADLLAEWTRDEATLDVEVPSEDRADLARLRRQLENLQRMSGAQLRARMRDSFGPQDRVTDRHEGKPALRVAR